MVRRSVAVNDRRESKHGLSVLNAHLRHDYTITSRPAISLKRDRAVHYVDVTYVRQPTEPNTAISVQLVHNGSSTFQWQAMGNSHKCLTCDTIALASCLTGGGPP